MARALELARLGAHRTSPNPTVGAVVIRDGRIVGEGFHQGPGRAHAEVEALDRAGERARGGQLFVTLEPCSIAGRTGPCTERILASGIAEVHAATLDPNPKVNGGGLERLRRAGLEVVLGEHRAEADALIEEFRCWVTTGLPWVTLKFAMSLDGKVATASGESQWISSEPARERAHVLRGEHDAVLVGSGTVLADDPHLNLRWGLDQRRQPLRVVVDSRLRISPTARLLRPPGGRVLVATLEDADGERSEALERAGAELLRLAPGPGGVSLLGLLRRLGEMEVTSLLVEGGPTLLGSFLEQRLGQRMAAFVAPLVVGGRAAPGPFGGRGSASLGRSWRASSLRAEAVGSDLLLLAEV